MRVTDLIGLQWIFFYNLKIIIIIIAAAAASIHIIKKAKFLKVIIDLQIIILCLFSTGFFPF